MCSPNDGRHLSAWYRGPAPTLSVREPSQLLSPADPKAPLVATRSSTYDVEDTERFIARGQWSGPGWHGVAATCCNKHVCAINLNERIERVLTSPPVICVQNTFPRLRGFFFFVPSLRESFSHFISTHSLFLITCRETLDKHPCKGST